ncbi:MAG: RHS repeat-associated core domain-containing protein [Candidatus Omnitrophota bacterium]
MMEEENKRAPSGSYIYSRSYTYDPAGNRTSENSNVQNITYTYNAGNQLTSRVAPGETINYTYNANGNLTTETSFVSGVKNYTYDYENRLTNVSLPGGTFETYAYSGDGRRISVNTNGNVVKYIYDDALPIIERDTAGSTLVSYTRIPGAPGGIGGMVSSTDGSSTLYYHCSSLGNINQITDASGNVIQTYEYDAFGNIVNESGSLNNDHQYKTKEYSANTGLVYFGARYYNPVIGRFITRDPMGMVDGPNLYLYCGNDPVNRIDPFGLFRRWDPRWRLVYEALKNYYKKWQKENPCAELPPIPGETSDASLDEFAQAFADMATSFSTDPETIEDVLDELREKYPGWPWDEWEDIVK